jgi:hypothetical protein
MDREKDSKEDIIINISRKETHGMTQNKMVQSVTGRHEKRGGSNFKGMAVR